MPLPALANGAVARNNISSFSRQDWRDHFDTLGKGAIVCDTASRALHYWSADGSDYRIYPTSVPKTDELTKRGYTEIVRKKVGPSWTPTASQMERFPTGSLSKAARPTIRSARMRCISTGPPT